MLPLWLLKFAASAWKILKEILFITIPLPVIVILAIGAWWYIDKTSAIKKAVYRAVVELVASAELEAKDKLIQNQSEFIADQLAASIRNEDRLRQEAKNADDFQEQLEASQLANAKLLERMNHDTAAQSTKTTPNGTVCPAPTTPDAIINGVRK